MSIEGSVGTASISHNCAPLTNIAPTCNVTIIYMLWCYMLCIYQQYQTILVILNIL